MALRLLHLPNALDFPFSPTIWMIKYGCRRESNPDPPGMVFAPYERRVCRRCFAFFYLTTCFIIGTKEIIEFMKGKVRAHNGVHHSSIFLHRSLNKKP
jgi:hypothetical protein